MNRCVATIHQQQLKAMKLKPNLSTRSEPPHGVVEAEYYVLDGGQVGEAVAKRLSAEGYTTALVDESYNPSELPGRAGDPTDVRTLKEVGLSDESTIVVASQLDGRNLLIAQLVSANFDVSRVMVLANAPERYDLLAEAGHEPVCATTALSEALVCDL